VSRGKSSVEYVSDAGSGVGVVMVGQCDWNGRSFLQAHSMPQRTTGLWFF
jgi:hypothetical protein